MSNSNGARRRYLKGADLLAYAGYRYGSSIRQHRPGRARQRATACPHMRASGSRAIFSVHE
jgi:hypothetical protein